MTNQVIYPHIEKPNASEPARLQRIQRVRVAQIVGLPSLWLVSVGNLPSASLFNSLRSPCSDGLLLR